MNPPDDTYHHGDLANTLRLVAADLIGERGAAGFSLREVARRAGVSHAAPTHHFGDAKGLLTAVAVDGFTHLRAASERAAAGLDDPIDRLVAIGRAYVEVSESNPGHCAVIFRHDLVERDDEAYQAAGNGAYDLLRRTVADVAAAVNPDLDVEMASRLCWATVQGIVQLHGTMVEMAEKDGLPPVPPRGELAEDLARMLVDGLRGSKPT